MGTQRCVVAVDGPSGAGKSTVSRQLATALAASYLDTGAMYRAVTLAALRAGVDLADADAVAKVAGEASVQTGTDPDAPTVWLDGADVAAEIRTPRVTSAVSAVSAVPAVRALLVSRQQQLIAAIQRVVVEGRDIGGVVAPEADLKVFLTASAEERTRRRSTETAADPDTTAAELARRDQLDSTRTADPLRQPPDAVAVDTTAMDLDTVVATLRELVTTRLRERPE